MKETKDTLKFSLIRQSQPFGHQASAIHKSKFNVNTTETNGNDKAKFMAAWKKENVDCSKDHARRKSIADDLSFKLATMDKNQVIVDLPQVKAKIGPNVKVCHDNYSSKAEVCEQRMPKRKTNCWK